MCRYEHFHERDPNETYEWWYQAPSDALFPPCENTCCGYQWDSTCCASGGTHRRCDRNYKLYSGAKCSPFQRNVIVSGSIPANNPSPATSCNFGRSYKWLDGLSNFPTIFGLSFNHWEVILGSVVGPTTKPSPVQTIAFLAFPTKWWMRGNTPGGGPRVGFNSLSQTDNAAATATDNAAADDRTPKWWVYACTGQPVFTWELYELSSLTTAEADAILLAVAAGEPLPAASMQKLEDDGILAKPQDWGDAQGRPIKKTMRYSTGFEQTRYFWGATGGWSFACQDFSATPAASLSQYWPQIPLKYSMSANFGGSCLTGAPIPGNNCACQSSGGPCDSCQSPAPAGCMPFPAPACGSGNPPHPCDVDVVIGNCKGVRMQYAAYQLAIPSATYSIPFTCQSNQSTLGRYEAAVEPANPLDPAPIDYTQIPPPADLSHYIPRSVSEATRNGDNGNPMCCGGIGVLGVGAVDCPANAPTGAVCT